MGYQYVIGKALFAEGQIAWKTSGICIFATSSQRLITLCSLSCLDYIEHQNNIRYVGSRWVEDHPHKLQDLGIHNVKSDVLPFARGHKVLDVPMSPRSCRNRTVITQTTDVSIEGCSLQPLGPLPSKDNWIMFFLFAFPLLVKCHTVSTPRLLALSLEGYC